MCNGVNNEGSQIQGARVQGLRNSPQSRIDDTSVTPQGASLFQNNTARLGDVPPSLTALIQMLLSQTGNTQSSGFTA
jgi:hypothetical protein